MVAHIAVFSTRVEGDNFAYVQAESERMRKRIEDLLGQDVRLEWRSVEWQEEHDAMRAELASQARDKRL